MSNKKLKKDGTQYFRQTETLRLLGGGLVIVGLVWFYFGTTYASYILPSIMAPAGIVMFILGSMRYISDNDMEEERVRLLADYDKAVTDRVDYDRLVLKHPADVEAEVFCMGAPAAYFKRGKNSTIVSDRCVKSHFFFTKDALLVCVRELSLTELGQEHGGVTDTEKVLYFSDMVAAELTEESLEITLTNTKKKTSVKQYWLTIQGVEGEMLRLPVKNDMDAGTLCDEINRKIAEVRKTAP